MNKEILRLAIPNIISNISIPLLSSVDTLLMGHLSTLELGAVGISSMIFNFLYWNFGFLRMGTTGMTAQAFGASDDQEITNLLQRSLLFSTGISLLLLVLMLPIVHLSNLLLNTATGQIVYVEQYFYIRIWAAPASLGLYSILGWLFGMQNARFPLYITLFLNLLNITLSYYFVKHLNWGIQGVAYGTLIAQYGGFLFAIVLILFKYRKYIRKVGMSVLMQWKKLKAFLNVNADIFIRTVCLSFAFAFLYSQSSLFGPDFLAANVVLLQFLNWMSYGIDGFAFASESLVGKYYGKMDTQMVNAIIKRIFIWGLLLALFYTVVYGFGGQRIILIFTDQKNVIERSNQFLIWVIVMPLIAFSCYIWDGIFIGLTASKAMRNSMLLSILVYLLVFYMTRDWMGFSSLWFSLLIFLFARGLFQSILYYRKGIELN